MFYMHLKQDSKLFTGIFVFPLTIAAVIIVGSDCFLMALSHLMWLMPVPRGDHRRPTSTDRPIRPELVTSSQRPHRHRPSRCLVFLWNRSAPPAGTAGGLPLHPLSHPLVLYRADSAAGLPERTSTRAQRLLPVLHPHGAAPGAHPGVSAAAALWHAGLGDPSAALRRGMYRVAPGLAGAGWWPFPSLPPSFLALAAAVRPDDAQPRSAHRHSSHVHGDRHHHVVAGDELHPRAPALHPVPGMLYLFFDLFPR